MKKVIQGDRAGIATLLIIVIVIVVIAGAGAAAYVVLSDNGDKEKDNGDNGDNGGDDGNGSGPSTDYSLKLGTRFNYKAEETVAGSHYLMLFEYKIIEETNTNYRVELKMKITMNGILQPDEPIYKTISKASAAPIDVVSVGAVWSNPVNEGTTTIDAFDENNKVVEKWEYTLKDGAETGKATAYIDPNNGLVYRIGIEIFNMPVSLNLVDYF